MSAPLLSAVSLFALAALAPVQPGAQSTNQSTTQSTAPAVRVLSLDEAVRTALIHQPQLLQAHANTDAARARVEEARAPLLPQVTGSASYQRQTGNFAPRPGSTPSGAMISGNTFDTYNYFNFGVTVNQYLWDFGQTTNKWYASQATARSQLSTERATQLAIVLGARAAYLTAAADRELVEVARETLDNQERHLKQIDGQVRVGARPEIDRAQARADRATAEAAYIAAQNTYAIAKAQLNLAIGVEGRLDYEVESGALPAIGGEDQPPEALVDEALRARPELLALSEQVRASELTVSSAKGAYGPSLGASMSLTDAGTDINKLAWNWNVGVGVTWNLFSGLLTRAQVKEARANVTAAEAAREGERQQVRLDVEQAALGVRAAKASLRANLDALENARERLRLAEGRYASGVGNVIELGDAQVAYTTAAVQKTQADFNLALARAQLLRALGRVG